MTSLSHQVDTNELVVWVTGLPKKRIIDNAKPAGRSRTFDRKEEMNTAATKTYPDRRCHRNHQINERVLVRQLRRNGVAVAHLHLSHAAGDKIEFLMLTAISFATMTLTLTS